MRLVALSHAELINSRYACLVTERYFIVTAACRVCFITMRDISQPPYSLSEIAGAAAAFARSKGIAADGAISLGAAVSNIKAVAEVLGKEVSLNPPYAMSEVAKTLQSLIVSAD